MLRVPDEREADGWTRMVGDLGQGRRIIVQVPGEAGVPAFASVGFPNAMVTLCELEPEDLDAIALLFVDAAVAMREVRED